MRVRTYGGSGPLVIALHGGPGAPGHMAPVARGLAARFRVLEPFQRGSGAVPLTVARHVEDLRELIHSQGESPRPALIGSSWGAMLALAFAAAHPGLAGPIVLIGCGTFDQTARARLRRTLDERTTEPLRRRMAQVEEDLPDPDDRLRALTEMTAPLYSCDLAERPAGERVDARAHEETWSDMVRLQERGVYPAAFAAIRSPVLMLHGVEDPHPGRLICESLRPHIPQLEYREWEHCGHYPWLERAVRDDFFLVLRDWLIETACREA